MEKTFEELIEENEFEVDNWNNAVLVQDVMRLLQQVREATIAECKDKIWDEYGIYRKAHEIQSEIENLPTDRIKLTENK